MDINKFLSEVDISKITGQDQRYGYILAKNRIILSRNGNIRPLRELSIYELKEQILKLEAVNNYPVALCLDLSPEDYPQGTPNIWYDIFLEELSNRGEVRK